MPFSVKQSIQKRTIMQPKKLVFTEEKEEDVFALDEYDDDGNKKVKKPKRTQSKRGGGSNRSMSIKSTFTGMADAY